MAKKPISNEDAPEDADRPNWAIEIDSFYLSSYKKAIEKIGQDQAGSQIISRNVADLVATGLAIKKGSPPEDYMVGSFNIGSAEKDAKKELAKVVAERIELFLGRKRKHIKWLMGLGSQVDVSVFKAIAIEDMERRLALEIDYNKYAQALEHPRKHGGRYGERLSLSLR